MAKQSERIIRKTLEEVEQKILELETINPEPLTDDQINYLQANIEEIQRKNAALDKILYHVDLLLSEAIDISGRAKSAMERLKSKKSSIVERMRNYNKILSRV